MTSRTPTRASGSSHIEPGPEERADPELERRFRAGGYGMLAALLRGPPDPALMGRVAGFAGLGQQGRLALPLAALGLAAGRCDTAVVEDEYHALFIGLGRGELVPYGSWYLTGFLMEKPLGVLRDDLAVLGFEREAGVSEPEDHVAALSEVMAMLIEEGSPLERQRRFFEAHIGTWFERFFEDLSEARSAVFYRAVGRFGAAFTTAEHRYMA